MCVAVDRRACDPARRCPRREVGFSLSPGHAVIKVSEGGGAAEEMEKKRRERQKGSQSGSHLEATGGKCPQEE